MVKKRKSSEASTPSSSVVEKLSMLRSFVGDDGKYTESDLSTCLRQSGYQVELAAERLMTGQFQPLAKRSKSSLPRTIQPLSAVPTKNVATLIRKPTPVTPSPATTRSSPRPSPPAKTQEAPREAPQETPQSNKDWLLCHRWISNGICIQRQASMKYQETLHVEATHGSLVRFRGERIQCQFPKSISSLLNPLLLANLVRVHATALMEERNLPTGAHIAFAVWIYLPDPDPFFALFQERSQTFVSATRQFFGQPKAKSMNQLCDAAFGLLQWAQNGETYDFTPLESEASELLDEESVVAEPEVPSWAESATDLHHDELQEQEAPASFQVSLRPYQKQALWWMLQREANEELEASSRQQFELLQELTSLQTPAAIPTSQDPIQCECGPVCVDPERMEAPPLDSEASLQPLHPLWERRYLTKADRSEARSFYVQSLFGVALASPPPPPRPCRGGILADSMGLGKTVMLLALIQATLDQERDGRGTTTLVITPLSLLTQWQEELESKTTMSCAVYYGDKKRDKQDLDAVDVVLTTYGSLQGEWVAHQARQNQPDNGSVSGGLVGHTWKRVILDEAHCIKNTATVAARACALLQAERRWCVSGTIIQNSLDDVYALLKFLRHEPWCEHSFWKAAISKVMDQPERQEEALSRVRRVLTPIMLRRTKLSVNKDGKPILTLPPVDTKVISVDFTPAERQFYDALHRKSLSLFEGFIQAGTASKSWLAIFSLLHRLRQTCDHVALTVKSHLNEDDWMGNITQNNENTASSRTRSKTTQTSASIDDKFLTDLMGRFQSMQNSKSENDSEPAPYAEKIAKMLNEAVQSKSSLLKEECAVCLDPINVHNSVVTPCYHIFCKDCLVDVLRQKRKTSQSDNSPKQRSQSPILRCPNGPCPVCSDEIDSSKILLISENDGHISTTYLHNSLVNAECVATKEEDGVARQALETAVNGSSSSKLAAILKELNNVWDEEPGSKVLIFSQFLGFLDLMGESFKSNKIPFSRLDGKLSLKERMAVLQEFGSDKQQRAAAGNESDKVGSVLLISMKAGGVGLNLVAARTVFITDPWWNAAVEDQCIDRIHRIGQTADKVRVRKFYVSQSVEERIVELQKRKKSVASEVLCDNGSMTKPNVSSSRPTLDDFKILFGDGIVTGKPA